MYMLPWDRDCWLQRSSNMLGRKPIATITRKAYLDRIALNLLRQSVRHRASHRTRLKKYDRWNLYWWLKQRRMPGWTCRYVCVQHDTNEGKNSVNGKLFIKTLSNNGVETVHVATMHYNEQQQDNTLYVVMSFTDGTFGDNSTGLKLPGYDCIIRRECLQYPGMYDMAKQARPFTVSVENGLPVIPPQDGCYISRFESL